MRTAVVRVNVDPSGALTREQLSQGMSALLTLADGAGADVVQADLARMPAGRREVELLIAGGDADTVKQTAMEMCTKAFSALSAFGATPTTGVITYTSRGTDDDAHGVLAGFGLTGKIRRSPDDEGFDVVEVTLRQADLEHIPESRIHTALEASLNCEVHIFTE